MCDRCEGKTNIDEESDRWKFAFLNAVSFYLKINLFDFYSNDTLTIFTTNVYTMVMDVRFCSDDCFFIISKFGFCVRCLGSKKEKRWDKREREQRNWIHLCALSAERVLSAGRQRKWEPELTWFYSTFFQFDFIAIICELTRPVFKCELTRDRPNNHNKKRSNIDAEWNESAQSKWRKKT